MSNQNNEDTTRNEAHTRRTENGSEEVEKGLGYGAPGAGSGETVPAEEGIPAEEAIEEIESGGNQRDTEETADDRDTAV
ncbi:hypothetical protein [Pedobacter sp. SYP-B3415]|uniref:hypothetical protein n=1 Tax=Pedobacter sp. SYP-B3415 TaxID=2496641 RepID=UPI00101C8E4A|nr:hypothetical protein [Pedobacter sp. SYP-B3415]